LIDQQCVKITSARFACFKLNANAAESELTTH